MLRYGRDLRKIKLENQEAHRLNGRASGGGWGPFGGASV
ncbi:MAG: hypothetical protein OJF52_000569 [Nitrospira sp.]|nr:MAG: hypothetical protein OJF52_000569 [Nitrospira sp.]